MAKRSTDKTTETGAKHRGAKVEALRPGEAKGPTHAQVALRAREIWERKGRPQGQDEKNWHEAEAELKREMGR